MSRGAAPKPHVRLFLIDTSQSHGSLPEGWNTGIRLDARGAILRGRLPASTWTSATRYKPCMVALVATIRYAHFPCIFQRIPLIFGLDAHSAERFTYMRELTFASDVPRQDVQNRSPHPQYDNTPHEECPHAARCASRSIGNAAQIWTISKSSFRAPHSGQVQLIGTSSQRVPGAIFSSGKPASSS